MPFLTVTGPQEDDNYWEIVECANCGHHDHAGNMEYDEEVDKDFCSAACQMEYLMNRAEGYSDSER